MLTTGERRLVAKCRPPIPRGMNGVERAFARDLEVKKRAGAILWWEYEAVKVRIGDSCFYTPDFAVVNAQGELELWEVKVMWRTRAGGERPGFRDDAKVKLRSASARFPARFFGAYARKGGGFQVEEF